MLGITCDFSVKVLTDSELFVGKITAALDRQEPRDLFDIKNLMDKEGLSDETRKAFLVYLISNPRPMHELLNANLPDPKDVELSYRNNLSPMMRKEISIKELMSTREKFITSLNNSFLPNEKDFCYPLNRVNLAILYWILIILKITLRSNGNNIIFKKCLLRKGQNNYNY